MDGHDASIGVQPWPVRARCPSLSFPRYQPTFPLYQVCEFLRASSLLAQLAKPRRPPVNVATIEVYLRFAARAHPVPRESGLLRGKRPNGLDWCERDTDTSEVRRAAGRRTLSPELIHT